MNESQNKTMFDMILVRYGEMTLKKDNYKQFLRKVTENIKFKLKEFTNLKFEAQPYRFYIYLNGEDQSKVIDKLNKVCGLWSYSLCKKVNKNLDDIATNALKMINEYTSNNNLKEFTFKVETARSDKQYPLTSLEISKKVAGMILPKLDGVKVDVHNPDVTLNIDFRFEAVYLYINEVYGIGGYPAGIQGKGLSMMSGGLDSPVSTYLTIKKGVKVSAIHFFSPPYTSYSALQKVIDLLQKVSVYTERDEIDLYIVPFTRIQDKIHENANNTYMVTLMRRAMYKIASMVVDMNNMDCIINGESIGQVASQTLESIKVVNDVTNIPIIRPLAAYDKDDIVKISKKIDCFDISIRPYEDCCTVFVPKHPAIKPNLEIVLEEENKASLDEEIDYAVEQIKKVTITKDQNVDAFTLNFDSENTNTNKFEI